MTIFYPNTYSPALFAVPSKVLLPLSICFWAAQHSFQAETRKFWIKWMGEGMYSKSRYVWNIFLYSWCANLQAAAWPESTVLFESHVSTVISWLLRCVSLLVLVDILFVPASPFDIRVQRYYNRREESVSDENDTGAKAFGLGRVSRHPQVSSSDEQSESQRRGCLSSAKTSSNCPPRRSCSLSLAWRSRSSWTARASATCGSGGRRAF